MSDERQILDPSRAIVDLDVMTLAEFQVSPAGVMFDDENSVMAKRYSVTVILTGGLGRIPDPQGNSVIVDRVNSLRVSGVYADLSDEQVLKMRHLLDLWQRMNTPLRFLDYADKAFLLEDTETLVVLPNGERHIEAAHPPRPFA
jgi:hypothetical protein